MERLLSWTVATVAFIHTSDSCEPGWIPYKRFSVCYKLFISPHLDWSSARNFCVRHNAKLTDIYDHKEQVFINESLIKTTRDHGVWVGASDLADFNDWRWVDNTRMDIDRFEWWEGGPDNGEVPEFFDQLIPGEDCLEISLKAKHRGRLNDYKCNRKMPFVCKMKDISTTTLLPQTTQIMTSQPSSETDNKSVIPVVSTVLSLCMIALLVLGMAMLIKRKRKQKSPNTCNNYEDADVTPPANENFYTCLETSNQATHQTDGARPVVDNVTIDDSSFHEYHSVHFPAIQARSMSAKSKSAVTK